MTPDIDNKIIKNVYKKDFIDSENNVTNYQEESNNELSIQIADKNLTSKKC